MEEIVRLLEYFFLGGGY